MLASIINHTWQSGIAASCPRAHLTRVRLSGGNCGREVESSSRDSIAFFLLKIYIFKLSVEFLLPFSSGLKKVPFTEYSAWQCSQSHGSGQWGHGYQLECISWLALSSGWGLGAGIPDLKPLVGISPWSYCVFASSSFLLAPEPALAHFHTASRVARSLSKLNFNYFFFFFLFLF